MVINDPLVTRLVGTGSCQRAVWQKDGWHLPGAASAGKQLGSDWEVLLLGTWTARALGVPQPPSSAQMLPAPASPPPSLLTGLCTNTPSCKCTQKNPQPGSSWLPHRDSTSHLTRVASETMEGKERSFIFTGNAEDVTFFPPSLHLQMKQAQQSLIFFLEMKFWKHFFWISPNVECQQRQSTSLQFGLFQTEVERTLKLNLFLNVILNKERNSSAWKC